MTIDVTIDALIEAAARAGVTLPSASPGIQDELDKLDSALAPLRIPDDLRRWWQRVDVRTGAVMPLPFFVSAEASLELWWNTVHPGSPREPEVLLDVGRESWSHMAIELVSRHDTGGRLFEYYLGDGEFWLRWYGLGDWLNQITRLIVAGNFDRMSTPSGPGLRIRGDDQFSIVEPYVPAPGQPQQRPQPISNDYSHWPEHWRLVNDDFKRQRRRSI